ncbi:MAG: hypothetical protein ISS61_07395 [Desulfobacteraceae bacterium]|nr:hypothetical protein [Desulfobacteraceae bacterium]
MFSLETETLKLRLQVTRVDSLLEHEGTLPHVADKLILEFKNWADLENPVIVDENNIVLDGNHRTYVFKHLKFKHIPVCKIGYFNKSVRLRYWFRMIGDRKGLGPLKQIIEEMGGNLYHAVDKETLIRMMEQNRFSYGVQQGNAYILVRFQEEVVNDAVGAYDVLEKIQERLREQDLGITYIPCQSVRDANFCTELGEGAIVIWTPQITKEMVVDAAKGDRLFAPKTTRHLIATRPLNVNAPIHWFKEDVSLEEIDERFSNFLKKKEIRRFGPGQVIDGRYYEEELFVFYDRR